MARLTRRSVAVVAVAAVGFAGCGLDESGPEPIDPHTADDGGLALADTAVGPTHTRHGVPQGWSHDGPGARAAAVSTVALTGDIARAGFITRGDMIDALATRRFAPELGVATERQLADLAEALGALEFVPPEVSWVEVPLTARLVDAGDDAARVEVWSVVVVASADAGVPRQAWRTVTIDLAWSQGDWKVDGWANAAGPTPALAAAAAVSSGDEVATTAGWPRAGVGGGASTSGEGG